jgi:hypothetical protein
MGENENSVNIFLFEEEILIKRFAKFLGKKVEKKSLCERFEKFPRQKGEVHDRKCFSCLD